MSVTYYKEVKDSSTSKIISIVGHQFYSLVPNLKTYIVQTTMKGCILSSSSQLLSNCCYLYSSLASNPDLTIYCFSFVRLIFVFRARSFFSCSHNYLEYQLSFCVVLETFLFWVFQCLIQLKSHYQGLLQELVVGLQFFHP